MKYAEIKNAVENNLKYFLKWAFLSILIGCAGGLIGGVFGLAIKKAAGFFGSCHWLLYLLPVSGIPAVKLPSTSPANAACRPETLREVWGEALKDYITVSNL